MADLQETPSKELVDTLDRGDHSNDPQPVLIGRYGSFFFIPGKLDSVASARTALRDALQADEHIEHIYPSTPDDKADRFIDLAQPVDDGDYDLPQIVEAEQVKALRVADPFHFTVRVPKRVQKTFWNEDFIPASDYIVRWDGLTIMVFWEASSDSIIPAAGGHAVTNVLRQVALAAGGTLITEGCTPDCGYEFSHTTLRIACDPTMDQSLLARHPRARLLVNITAPIEYDPHDLAYGTFAMCILALDRFSQTKNLGHRILNLQTGIETSLEHLLLLQRKLSTKRWYAPNH